MKHYPSLVSSILLLILLITTSSLFAQNKVLKGRIINDNNQGIANASIKIPDLGIQLYTDSLGNYSLQINNKIADRTIVTYSYLGKETESREYNLQKMNSFPAVLLKNSTFALDEITVQAKQGQKSNSSLLINRDMIERYPSLSLNDILNFLPNRRIMAPSVQAMQNVNLRGAFAETSGSARNVNQMNNSFGTAIIMDDMVLSNNSNMQSRNPNITGLSRANLSVSSSDYNIGGDNIASNYSGESAFGGVDIRQIPTESIESIEVISGVAPVRYGDITDGAIIVERQAGRTPAFFRLQTRNDATSYGMSKGFKLSPSLGDLNLDLSYVNSYADNRDKLKQYERINGSAIWTIRYGKSDKWKQTVSGTYNKTLDGVNKDPDDPESTAVTFGGWNYSVSSRLSYQPNGSFLKRIGFNLGLQEGHQVSYREYYYNDAYVLYTDTTGTGVVEGTYDTGQYTAINHIDGRPISINGRLEANAVAKIAGLTHYLNFGTNVDYSKNNGLGRISDPSRPNKGIGQYSERYYDYSLIHPSWNIGFYLEDRINAKLAGKPLNITAGVRMDFQNGHPSISPRTNLNYKLNEHSSLGLAYGLGFKSPSLAHLYPGPTFMETILLNAYNGLVNESTNRIFVYRFDPKSEQLKPQFSQTLEATFRYGKDGHHLAFNTYYKANRRGFNSTSFREIIELPKYEAIARPGEKPLVEQIGSTKYFIRPSQILNAIDIDNLGFEIMYSTPKIPAIYTSFNVAGGFTSSVNQDYYISEKEYNREGSDPKDVIIGIYLPLKRQNFFSQGRIGSSTHFPRLRLIVEMIADFQLMNVQKTVKSQYFPLAYYTRDMEYVAVDQFDMNNPQHAFLYDQRKKEFEEANDKGNLLYGNFHLNVAKEIGDNLRLSFNVYNFLDYQPRIRRTSGTSLSVLTPNMPPNYGAQITYKF